MPRGDDGADLFYDRGGLCGFWAVICDSSNGEWTESVGGSAESCMLRIEMPLGKQGLGETR